MLINKYYDSSEQEEKKNEYYIQELQKYIHEKNISSKDADQLNRWVEQQKVLHVRVYKGDIVVFESEYPEQNYGKRRFRQMNMSGWIITRSNLQMVRLR